MRQTLLFLTGTLLTFSIRAAELKPVFHADFDRDFRAMTTRGTILGKHASEINMETLSLLLQKGIKGKAAKIGAQEIEGKTRADYIHYPGEIVHPEHGTISFWLKPIDWSFRDGKFHIFCEAIGPKGWLTIYKYANAHELYFLFGSNQSGGNGVSFVLAAAPGSKWEKGTFRHITATWNKTHIRLYLDGILQSTVKIPATCYPEKFTQLSIGPRSAEAWKNQIGDSLIDDFQVFDKTLSAAEVEELFASYGIKKIDKSKIPVEIVNIKAAGTPDGKQLDFNFSLSRTTSQRKGFPVAMLVLKDGKKLMSQTLKSASAEYHYSFDTTALRQGDYLVQLFPQRELPTDKIKNGSFRFTIGTPRRKVDHSVPAPWKPVVFKNGELSALMQKTVFKTALLPEQLISEKMPLLRQGMRFILNSKALTGKVTERVVEKHPDYQIIERTLTHKDFTLVSRCRFEFDGMMWFDLTLTPRGKLSVQNAKIEVPFKPEFSTLYNQMAKDYFNFRGFTTAGKLDKVVRANHFLGVDIPVIWVGNEERGLYYFTADQAGRRLKNRAETIRLEPGKAGALLSINLIDYASALDKAVTWSMGFHVTPMRPLVRRRTLNRPGVAMALWFPWADIHNVPDARFKYSNYARIRRQWSAGGTMPIFHYFAGFSVSPENPSYPLNARRWSLTPPSVGTEFSPNNREWRYVYICANSENYRNTYLNQMEKCIRDLKMDNLYFDNCWSRFCNNSSHGCGWRDEKGVLYPTCNILGNREIAKGCYRLLRKAYPEGMISRHISQIPEPPLVSFADNIVDGECFMLNVGRDENYYNLFKPDYFRTAFMGVQFGLPSIFIAQFNRAYHGHFPEKLAAAKAGKLKNQKNHLRHFMGYTLAHDSDVWPNFGVDAKSIWKIMDRTGVWDENPFYGYWNSKNPVKKCAPAGERVMVSSYACNKGTLTVLMNDTDQPVTVKLALDKKFFGPSPVVTDAETRQAADPAAVRLPARNFRLLHIVRK